MAVIAYAEQQHRDSRIKIPYRSGASKETTEGTLAAGNRPSSNLRRPINPTAARFARRNVRKSVKSDPGIISQNQRVQADARFLGRWVPKVRLGLT